VTVSTKGIIVWLTIIAPVGALADECSGKINKYAPVYAHLTKDNDDFGTKWFEPTQQVWAAAKKEGNCQRAIACRSVYEYQLLFTAVHRGDEKSVLTLLESGIDPSGSGSELMPDCLGLAATTGSPLLETTKQKNLILARLLLNYGADPDSPNFWESYTSSSPLNIAIKTENVEMADLLLEFGAKNYVSKDDAHHRQMYSTIDWAKEIGNSQLIRVLEKARAEKLKQEYSPLPGSTERKRIMAAIRRDLAMTDQFIVSELTVRGKNAYFFGRSANVAENKISKEDLLRVLLYQAPNDWKVIAIWTNRSKEPKTGIHISEPWEVPGGQMVNPKWPP